MSRLRTLIHDLPVSCSAFIYQLAEPNQRRLHAAGKVQMNAGPLPVCPDYNCFGLKDAVCPHFD